MSIIKYPQQVVEFRRILAPSQILRINTTESKEASENRNPDPTLTTFGGNGSVSQINDDVKIKLSLQKSTNAENVKDNLIKQNKNIRVA